MDGLNKAVNGMVQQAKQVATTSIKNAAGKLEQTKVTESSQSKLSLPGKKDSEIVINGPISKESIETAIQQKTGKTPEAKQVDQYIAVAKEIKREGVEAASKVAAAFAPAQSTELGKAVTQLTDNAKKVADQAVAA